MSTPDASVWATIARAWRANSDTIAVIAANAGLTAEDIKLYARTNAWAPRNSTAAKRKKKPVKKPATKTVRKRAAPQPKPIPAAPLQPPQPTTLDPAFALPSKPPNSLSARRALIRRMYSAIDTKLQLLELHMQNDLVRLDTGTDSSSADHERDTRAIGTLIKNLGTIADIDHANRRPKPGDKSGDNKSGDPVTGLGVSTRSASARYGGLRNAPADIAALADEADRFRRELAARLQRIVDTHP